MSDFTTLGLSEPLLRALSTEGYTTPTPIQAQSIPHLLKGRDLLGIAQTGTGKTAAFALPILQRILAERKRPEPRSVGVLVLAPTRELAAQIAESFRVYGRYINVSVGVVVGGAAIGPQIKQLARGLDVLVATPGRLLDHLSNRNVRLDLAQVVVLDEADHMLDLGFIIPIREILKKLPKQRQSLFFSATMPKEIASLANDMLRDPVQVAVTPLATTAERISQEVFLVNGADKRDLLVELLGRPDFQRTIVFTRTKRGADRVSQHLETSGIKSAAIHGNKSQGQRQRALESFRAGRARVLVATDIAARGIDVDGITHVVNFELPEVPEAYVHRIGRTARAGAAGAAVSLCGEGERGLLRAIEKLTQQILPVVDRRSGEWATERASDTRRDTRSGPRGANQRSRTPPARRRPESSGPANNAGGKRRRQFTGSGEGRPRTGA